MERLKVLGTWLILVIMFFIFSNIMIKQYLKKIKASEVNTNNTQVVTNQEKNSSF